jgi:hypothetical protein
MGLPKVTDKDVLNSIAELGGDGYCLAAELGGDGYCLAAELLPLLPKLSHADRRRALHRAVSSGLVIERRGPDGRTHVAIASEGWRQLRAA